MNCVQTKAGLLKDAALEEYYETGQLKRCILKQKNPVDLACGTVVPIYEEDGKRKRLLKSMTFYPGGNPESVMLQDITAVQTKIGRIPAEAVTFYESGAVKRIFPSFGSISAFWTEEDEWGISPEISLELPFGSFTGKAINLMFYESGDLRSMTLWPKDSINIDTPAGRIWTRIGFGLYPDGKIRSVEPLKPVSVQTPVGWIPAFDPDANGMDGDKNSLAFFENGSVQSLVLACATIHVFEGGKKTGVFAPASKKSDYFDDAYALVPIKVEFAGDTVCLKNKKEIRAVYSVPDCNFLIEPFDTAGFRNTCRECHE